MKVHAALVHEEKKTFQCFLCQGSFDTKLKLQKHEKEFHDKSSVNSENITNKTKDRIRNNFIHKEFTPENKGNKSDELILPEITDKITLITPKKETHSEKIKVIDCENVCSRKIQSNHEIVHLKRVHGEKITSSIISQGILVN